MSRKSIDPSLATFRPPSAPRPWFGHLSVLLGLVLALGAPLAVFGPARWPALEPLAEVFARHDLRPDVVLGCGLLLMVLGRLASYGHRQVLTLLEPGLVAHDLEQVDAGLRELQSRMKELRDEQALTRERLAGLARQVSEHRDVSAAGHEAAQNAMFRLAASLDQLGANVEHVVRDGSHEVQERIIEGNQLTEASRDFITENVEEMGRELAHYVYELVTSLGGGPPSHLARRAFVPAPPHEAPVSAAAAPAPAEPEEFDAGAYSRAAGYDTAETGAENQPAGSGAAEEVPRNTGEETLDPTPGAQVEDFELPGEGATAESGQDGGEEEACAPEPESPLGLLDRLGDPDPGSVALDPLPAEGASEPIPALPTLSLRDPGRTPPAGRNEEQGEDDAAPTGAGPQVQHQPLPTVLPPLNPRDPRNLNG